MQRCLSQIRPRKPTKHRWLKTFLALLILALLPPVWAGADDITKQDAWLRISIGNRSFKLAARIFSPVGAGPYPLVVINHGIPVSSSDARKEKLGFSIAASWFAAHGYIVVIALRPGFGDSDGPYLESSGPCSNRDYVHDGRVTALVESAIVQAATELPRVNQKQIVVVGQSAGGFGAIALGDTPPPGVVGIISFAGGRGGDDHEHICSGAEQLARAAQTFGAANQVPQLWLFADNDHFFPPNVAKMLFDAYHSVSRPPVRFVALPPFDGDGHKTLGHADPSVWADSVLSFLASIGDASLDAPAGSPSQ
jgi:dienelactone hydrolase